MEPTVSDEKYAISALREATKSDLCMRHGCVAVVSGKIVARGHNHYRTYSNDGLLDTCFSCHAEIDVLRKCLKQEIKKKITMYIVRLGNDGGFANAAPCKHCLDSMKTFNVKNIVYSNIAGDLVKMKINNFETDFETSGHVAIRENRIICLAS